MDHISKKHWETVYTEKSPLEVSWFQEEPATSLKIIQSIGTKQARIIDVGGGTSTLVDHLLNLGYGDLAVLDISGNAIDAVKNRLGEQANNVEWFENDVTQCSPPHTYDIWHDRAAFHFLTDIKSREAYKEILIKSTQSGSHAIIAIFVKDGPKNCSGLDIMQHDNHSIRREFEDDFKLLESLFETHQTPNGNEQHFIYFILRRK